MQYTVCFISVCIFDMFMDISAKVASAAVVTPFAVMADANDDFPSLTDFFNCSKLLFNPERRRKAQDENDIKNACRGIAGTAPYAFDKHGNCRQLHMINSAKQNRIRNPSTKSLPALFF